ncbi:hypothetical protein BDC45DRAFT_550450 [Circinella umbellata]|nr:hypothetical protein BDC45DRAFT_550450 [Circinella umbellata]
MVQTSNKQLTLLKNIPHGYPVVGEHIDVKESTIDLEAPLEEGAILLKIHIISADPFMRSPMKGNDSGSFFPPYLIGQPMYGMTVSSVIKSNNAKFNKDDLVVGITNIEEYTVIDPSNPFFNWLEIRNKTKTSGLPLSYAVSVLGMPGQTAYHGLLQVGKPKEGETLYVSAASGAVGQLVGQIGKQRGLKVVGSAGSDEKVAYLKEIGFDEAFNYKKTSSITNTLKELCPNGIDIYFDNVGGEQLEAAIDNANHFARFPLCGMISTYNTKEPVRVRNMMSLMPKHITLEGFSVSDYFQLNDQFTEEVTGWLKEGKIQYRETIAGSIDEAAQAVVDVFYGKNFGKQSIYVSDPSF